MKKGLWILLFMILTVRAGVNDAKLNSGRQVFIGVVPGVAAGFDQRLDTNLYLGGSLIFQPVKETTIFFSDKFLLEAHGVFNFYNPSRELPVSMSVFLGIVAGKSAYLQGGIIGEYAYRKWDFKLSVGYSPRAGIEAAYKLRQDTRLYFALFNGTGLLGVKFSLK